MKLTERPDYDPTKHNYYAKVVALGLNLPTDSAHEADVMHEDSCSIYRDDYCDCDCVVTLRSYQQ